MRGMNCNRRAGCGMHGSDACRAAMETIRALDFAIQETVLYLDAYPEDRQALAYYHRLIGERRAAMESYEGSCGPITMYGNTDPASWNWINGPWPWERDAN